MGFLLVLFFLLGAAASTSKPVAPFAGRSRRHQDASLSGIFCWYKEEHLGSLTPAMVQLRSSGQRPAAMSSRAPCCLPTSPGALRTKPSEATPASQRSLDQQANSTIMKNSLNLVKAV
jgi:hypothetical protein